MDIDKYRQRRIAETLTYALASAALGIAFSAILRLTIFAGDQGTSTFSLLLLGGLTGGIICATLVSAEPLLEKLYALPLWVSIAVMPVIYAAVIGVEYGAIFSAVMGFDKLFGRSLILETIVFSLAMSLAMSFIGAVNRLLGNDVLAGLIIGKYHRPASEERFVMYLDLAGSTTVAERLGNIGFHRLLNDFFRDIAPPVLRHGGDIYKYVGDEAIITWKKKEGAANANAVATFFAVADQIASREEYYRETYGVVPEFRAGLHFGDVIVGEMGDYKREIAILGDVMNTAARVQAQCRVEAVSFLASRESLDALGDFPGGALFRAESHGGRALRGKEKETELAAIFPAE